MSSVGKDTDQNFASLIAIALVLAGAMIFGFAYTSSANTVLSRIHSFIVNPFVLSLIVIFFMVAFCSIVATLIKHNKRKRGVQSSLETRQDALLNPIRMYSINEVLPSEDELNFNEIPGKLAQLARRGDHGVPDLVDAIIGFAVQSRSSDIHIEPYTDLATIRFRQDGVLSDVGSIPGTMIARVASRLRVLANLTIYEKGKPQDGRIEIRWGKESFDLRISFLPTLHGDKVVIRLFESGEHDFDIRQLGFSDDSFEVVTDILERPQGTVFLTGPTGSGKTTTIYSSLKYILQNCGDRTNIVTIEDPIEREIAGINQTQVNAKRELTFASGLRSILRQDPDVIVVGEVRDHETAEICTQAGLTGHMVISTIHADSAVGVFNRLIDMKIEPFLVASSVCGIISQRLVKKNCPFCSEPIVPTLKTMKTLKIKPTDSYNFVKGKGCEKCHYRGYKGRVGVFEILKPSTRLKDALQNKARSDELYRIAMEDGMITLRMDGLQKVRDGVIDVEELARILI